MNFLFLNNNRIKTLEDGAFSGLVGLTELHMSHNRLTEINPGAFNDLTALTYLSMFHNDITSLGADTFSGLPKLTYLNVDNNPIANIHVDTFDPLTSLDSLYLESLDLMDTDWHEDLFESPTNLTTLSIRRNGITTLDVDIFDDLTKLTTLQLSENAITALPDGIFDGLTSLTKLHLNHNGLSTLPANIFDDLTALQELVLSNNSLSSLPSDVFNGLTSSLTILYMHRNSLPSLHVDVFDGLTGLNQLALSFNKLTTVHEDLFDETTALEYLYLNNNEIASVPENTFDGLTSLRELYLGYNKLTTVNEDLFDQTTALQVLSLYNNSLATLDADIFDGLTTLQRLYLEGNSLDTLDADIFDGLTALQLLYLHGNSLATLDADIFDGLVNLGTLYLNDNGLTALPATLFDGLDNTLQQLVLTDNSISTLPAMVFAGLTGLKGLDLSCNSLNALDLSRFDPFASSLTYLDITGNSFITPPTDTAVRAKLTTIANLYISEANTDCLLPDIVGLSGLTVSVGTLDPAFEAPGSTSAYGVDVAHDATSIVITPTTTDPHAVVTSTPADIDLDAPGIQVNLTGRRTYVSFKVTAENGVATRNYVIEVYRNHPPATNARLRSLTLSGVTITENFGSRTYAYTATTSLATTTVTPELSDPDATAVIKLGGVPVATGTVNLAAGSNIITVEVTAEDGTTMQTYTVTVTRQATVSFGRDTYYVSEGEEVTLTVELSIALSRDVLVTLVKQRMGSMPGDFAVPANITFAAYETSASFTFTAIQDTDVENEESVQLNLFVDPSLGVIYGDHQVATVHIIDDDIPGMTVTPRTLDVDEGGTVTYTVKLTTVPTGNVTVAISSNDPGAATVFPETLTFTPTDWNTARTVTVTGEEDSDQDNGSVTLTHSASGADYGSVSTVDVTVDVTDNDSPGVSVSMTALTVVEENTTGDSYTVALHTQPMADVTVTVAGYAGTDVTPDPTILTFTTQNWATAQTVTVTAGNDGDTVNDSVRLTHRAASTDFDYQGIAIASVVVTVTDNDSPSTPPTTGGGGGGGGGGGFGAALVAPQFVDGFRTSRTLALNARVGDAVGDPVAATHPDDLAVTYRLSGTDAALFTVDEETGQIRLGQAITLVLGQRYTVNLTATDSSGTGALMLVDIEVAEAQYHRYDLNKNGSIEKIEVLAAVSDYFAGVIEKPLVLEVVSLYFAA